jgi:hypothetical protein
MKQLLMYDHSLFPLEEFGVKNSEYLESLYRPITGPEGSRRMRLPDFMTTCTRR